MDDKSKDVFNAEDVPTDLLSELVGENKKYKTGEDLARSRLEADKHIAKLELEARELREKLAAAKSVEDVLDAVKANSNIVNDTTNEREPAVASAPSQITPEDIAKIVAEQITGRETASQKARNKQKANDLLVDMFGDKAGEIFNSEASSPELRATLTQLAEVSPEKFASYFKREASKSAVDDGGSSRNVNVLNQNNTNNAIEGTQAYYNKLRKENPKLYYSAATQLAMHENALKNPAKYFGR